jgi:hypothetical protein
VIIGTLPKFGANVGAVWTFAAGVIAIFLLIVIIMMGVSMIKRFIR